MSNNGVVLGNITDNAALVFNNPVAQTYGGVISGSGAVTVSAAGTETLTGANTYSGGTTINSGATLQIGNGGSAGSLGSGNIVDNGSLVYKQNRTTFNLLTGAAFTRSGTHRVPRGGGGSGGSYYDIYVGGNMTLGGSLNFTQVGGNAGGNGYQGICLTANTTLTGSSISMTGDVGEMNNNGNYTLALNTSAANGPINLNISLTRPNVWYGLAALTANSGTGTITVAGTGPQSSGWNVTPVTLTGGIVNILANINSSNPITVNPAFTSTDPNAFSGTMSLTMGGAGTLILTNTNNSYSGGTTINAGTLQLGDGVSNNGAVIGNITDKGTLAFANPFAQTYASVISGTGAVTLTGAGGLTFTGANNYTGATSVSGENLTVSNIGAYSSGTTTIAANETFTVNVSASTTQTAASNINFTGSGTLLMNGPGTWVVGASGVHANFDMSAGGLVNIAGGTIQNNFTGSSWGANLGSVNIASGATLDLFSESGQMDALTGSGTLQNGYGPGGVKTVTIGVSNGSGSFGGVISGIGGNLNVVKSGTGTETFTGANTYGGTTTISGGTLQIAGAGSLGTSGTYSGSIADNGAFVFSSSANQTLSGALSGTGAFTMSGNGVLAVTGAGSLSGTTTISGGTLQYGNGGSTGYLGSGNIVDNGNLVYNYNSTTAINMLSGSAISGSGSLSVTAGGGGSGSTYGDINLAGNITLGGSLSFTQVGSNASANLYQGIQVQANTTLTGSSISMTGDVGEENANGNYSLALNTSAANGPINLNISLTRPGVWYGLAAFTANSGTGTITVAGTGLLSSGWNVTPVTLTGGIVNILANINSSNPITVNPAFTSTDPNAFSGTMSLTKGGAGTLILTSTGNSYTGATTISGGTLQLGDGVTSNGVVAGNIADNATLAFANPFAQTYAGVISGTGQVTKSGTGTLTFTGASSYNGGTTISTGRLVELDNGSSLGTGTTAISSGATVELSNTTGTLISQTPGTFTGAGTIQKTGTGQITFGNNGGNVNVSLSQGGLIDVEGGMLNGSSDFQGIWTNNQGSLNIASGATVNGYEHPLYVDALTGSGTLTEGYQGTSTTTIGVAGGSGTFSGVMANSGAGSPAGTMALVKTGTGTETLTGANTYTAGTTINGGTLQIGNGSTGSVSTSSALSVATGTATLAFDEANSSTISNSISDAGTVAGVEGSGIANTLSGVVSGSGGFTQSGVGTTKLNGANTYTGATNVNGGTVIVAGSISGSPVHVNGGILVADGSISSSLVNVAGGTLAGGSVGASTPPVNITGNVIVGTGSGAASSSIIAPSAGGGVAAQTLLNIQGNLTLNSDSAFQFKLDSSNAGYVDQLSVSGTLTLTGALLTGADIASSTTVPIGTQYFLAQAGSISGAFANAAQGADIAVGSNLYSVDYTQDGGTVIDLTLVGAIPEPGTWGTILLGFAMLVGFQRSRRWIP